MRTLLMPEFLKKIRFHPRLVTHLKGYQAADLRADLAAGVTVGIVALPLAIAFGIASGARPEHGIVTAIVAGFLISALGGSRVQIGGPAGAFVALLYAIVERYGIANLLIATSMAGVLLFAMGAFRMGNLVRFVPVSIIIGFTAGIAVIIGLSQVKDFLGLPIDKMPSNFFSQLKAIGAAISHINLAALIIGASSLALIAIWPVSSKSYPKRWQRIAVRFPSTLVVLVVWGFAVKMFELPVETIGTRFGELPRGLPMPTVPTFDWETAQNLVAPTLAIALLGAIESLLCARVADGMIDDRHDPNQELMAQGVANFFTPFFGGIAATGTIARTVTNVKSGARTPVAGIVHAITLLLIVLAAAPFAVHIPLAALAAVLVWVAINMGDWAEFARLRQYSVFYRSTLLVTFCLTVVFDLVVAVEVGLVLASLFFIYRISSLTRVDDIELPYDRSQVEGGAVRAYRVYGALFFGAVNKVEFLLDPARALPKVLILDLEKLINLDTTGMDALDGVLSRAKKCGTRMIITGVNEQPLSLMQRSGFLTRLGEANRFSSFDDALYDLDVWLDAAASEEL
ncbi:MAG TPA: SulP family inorganic anion transporter [Usitatibacteraceae bacterium]|nr:SulP family inorganic anion transporter [Usitatibacteraceae bacterium]